MIKKFKTVILLLMILSSLCFLQCQSKLENQLALKNWNIVKKSISEVTKPNDLRQKYIKEIYSNLATNQQGKNFLLLHKIKELSSEIKTKIKIYSDYLYKKQSQMPDDEIFIIGIEYINASKELEALLPEFYQKINDDILGKETKTNDKILFAVKNVMAKTKKYQDAMNFYRKDNNLNVKEITIL